MADRAIPDQNHIFSITAVSNLDGITPVALWADPVTHQLLANTKDDTASSLTIRMDESTANVLYVGKAPVGTAESAQFWQISKLDTSSTSDEMLLYANGSTAFNQAWNNRASLSYS